MSRPRPGRDLEELVAKLEGIVKAPEFADSDLEVISPAFWVDPQTGEKREVDVSLGPKGAPPNECIMVECRDRGNRQDSMWLEQVEGKRRSLSPKHVIVVSRRGFTRPAMKKAAAWGIELRLFEDLDIVAVQTWMSPGAGFTVYHTCMVTDNISIDLARERSMPENLGTPRGDGRRDVALAEVVFVDSSNGRVFETKDLGYLLGDKVLDELRAHLRPNGGSKYWNIRLDVPPVDPLMMRTKLGDIPVAQLRFKLTMWLNVRRAPPSARSAYVGQDGEKFQMVTFEGDWTPSVGKFTLVRSSTPNEDGSHTLYFMYEHGVVPDTMVPPPLDSEDAGK